MAFYFWTLQPTVYMAKYYIWTICNIIRIFSKKLFTLYTLLLLILCSPNRIRSCISLDPVAVLLHNVWLPTVWSHSPPYSLQPYHSPPMHIFYCYLLPFPILFPGHLIAFPPPPFPGCIAYLLHSLLVCTYLIQHWWNYSPNNDSGFTPCIISSLPYGTVGCNYRVI